jgi:calcineurin-like phosphoesterase family protein
VNNVWVTADQHFNHSNIIKYENRPFADVDEMNKSLIEAWNSVVSKCDKVFLLGDFGFGGSEFIGNVLSSLRGNKILVMGNHDRSRSIKKWIELGFKAVYEYPVIYDTRYILSHTPLDSITECSHFYNIFGHVHSNEQYETCNEKGFCVCVERHDYKPVLWRSIKDALKQVN